MQCDNGIIIRGEQVGLGPRRSDLIPTYLQWVNDPEVNAYLTLWGSAMSLEDEEAWYRSTASQAQRLFTVYHLASGEPIGNLGLHNIDHANRTALLGIMLGNRDYWGQGLGTEAVRLGLDFGFCALNLNAVRLSVHAHNDRALRCYEKAGFKRVGQFRQVYLRAGVPVDEILMDILASEFESPVLGPMLARHGLEL